MQQYSAQYISGDYHGGSSITPGGVWASLKGFTVFRFHISSKGINCFGFVHHRKGEDRSICKVQMEAQKLVKLSCIYGIHSLEQC